MLPRPLFWLAVLISLVIGSQAHAQDDQELLTLGETIAKSREESAKISNFLATLDSMRTSLISDFPSLPDSIQQISNPNIQELKETFAAIEKAKTNRRTLEKNFRTELLLQNVFLTALVPNLSNTYVALSNGMRIVLTTSHPHSVGEYITGVFKQTGQVQLLEGALLTHYSQIQSKRANEWQQLLNREATLYADADHEVTSLSEMIQAALTDAKETLNHLEQQFRLLSLYVDAKHLLRDGKFTAAMHKLQSLLAVDQRFRDAPQLHVQALIGVARQELTAKNYPACIDATYKVDLSEPDNREAAQLRVHALQKLAESLQREGDFQGAYTCLRNLYLSNPTKEAHEQLRELYRKNEAEISLYHEIGGLPFPPAPPFEILPLDVDFVEDLTTNLPNMFIPVTNYLPGTFETRQNIFNNDTLVSVSPLFSRPYTVRCLSFSDNEQLWQKHFEKNDIDAVLFSRQGIFLVDRQREYNPARSWTYDFGFSIIKLRLTDGFQLGSFFEATQDEVLGAKLIHNYVLLYVKDRDFVSLILVNTIDGDSKPLPGAYILGSVYVEENWIYAVNSDHTLVRFDSQTLTRDLTFKHPFNLPSLHSYKDVRIYNGQLISSTFNIDLRKKQIRWQGRRSKSQLKAISRRAIYSLDVSDETTPKLVAQDLLTGKELWVFDPTHLFEPDAPSQQAFGPTKVGGRRLFYTLKEAPLLDVLAADDIVFVASAAIPYELLADGTTTIDLTYELIVGAYSIHNWNKIWQSETLKYQAARKVTVRDGYGREREQYQLAEATPTLVPTNNGIILSFGNDIFLIRTAD